MWLRLYKSLISVILSDLMSMFFAVMKIGKLMSQVLKVHGGGKWVVIDVFSKVVT